MKLSQWRKHIFYMNDKEIVQYYGQYWENIKHMKTYIKELRERYILEVTQFPKATLRDIPKKL
jgi:hypothetical protein